MNQQLIDSYVAGRLGEKEAEEFEAYCLAHPEFARQVESEQLLRAGVRRVAHESPGEFAAQAQARTRAARAYWPLALAASLALAIGIAWIIRMPGAASLPMLTAVGTDAGALPVMRLAMVRSAVDGLPQLPPGRVRVEIAGLFDPGADYTVWLQRQDAPVDAAAEAATLPNQRSASGTSLQVIVEGERLAAGAYTLKVQRAQSPDEPLELVFFKN